MSDLLDNPMEKKKLPSGLNVLTILTFIGSGLGLVGTLWQFTNSKKAVEGAEKMVNSAEFNSMPDFAKKMYSPEAIELMRKMDANKLPLLVTGILGAALCIWGAIEMRKLKASGYLSYVMGCIIPFIGFVIFVGVNSLTNMQSYVGIAITVLFIILYTAQRKHLINK
jgi:hypothetical protein